MRPEPWNPTIELSKKEQKIVKLIKRTVELAQKSKKFGSRQLRAALDSSPLWGAAKVEDTYNLLGHALSKSVIV